MERHSHCFVAFAIIAMMILVVAPMGDSSLSSRASRRMQRARAGSSRRHSQAIDPTSGWSCDGTFNSARSPTGAYYATNFGCSSDPAFTDDSDNCCPGGVVQAAAAGLCPAGVSTHGCTGSKGTPDAIACERAVNWYSTGATAFGLGTRLCLTRPGHGSVVVFVIDDGPNCRVESRVSGFVLDVSYPTIHALFGSSRGASERAAVTVQVVPDATPLGVTAACPGAA